MLTMKTLPPLPKGTADRKVYPAGCGLADDSSGDMTGMGEMRIVYNVWDRDFRDWAEGLSVLFGAPACVKEDASGIYYEYACENETLYTYYIYHSREMKIVIDRAGLRPGDLTEPETAQPGDAADTLLIQYGLYYGKMVRMVTSDCGMCYFIRLPDRRIIMLDGGEIEQCTKPAVEDVMKLLRELSGTQNGGVITIAAWLCTHAHDDHMDLFSKLIKEYEKELKVERIIFNFPAHGTVAHGECVKRLKSRIARYAPDAKYMKIHTRQSITLAGAEITALLTHEDILPMRHRRPYDGMNGTTTVFKITANGKSFIALGDLQDEGARELAARYTPEELTCDYLQAAHHCINSVRAAYSRIAAGKVLIPQAESDCRERNLHNFRVITEYNRDENCVFAGNGTDIFVFGDSCESVSHRPQAGIPYDGSEF